MIVGSASPDADRLTLEEERDFLLRSLRDLDAEWEAGDLDQNDYRTLRDDYTARAATVLHALASSPPSDPSAEAAGPHRRWSPLRLALASGLVAAAISGSVMAVVFSSGQRRPNQSISGLMPSGADPRLNQARTLIGKKDFLGAIKQYDRVLADNPQQPEALTYRGWLLRLTSLQAPNLTALADQGLQSIERAERADPTYPDAHVFRGIILYQDRHDPVDAVNEFRTFLSLDPANPMAPTVEALLQRALAEPSASTPPTPGK